MVRIIIIIMCTCMLVVVGGKNGTASIRALRTGTKIGGGKIRSYGRINGLDVSPLHVYNVSIVVSRNLQNRRV